jgi:hypothetical protein
MAKPYKFLLWEQKNIYPLIIRGYNPDSGDDLSSVGGKLVILPYVTAIHNMMCFRSF